MVLLYARNVSEIQFSSDEAVVEGSLSYLKGKEKELLLLLIRKYRRDFTPIELSRELKVTNRTIINRISALSKNGFVIPKIVNKRIRSYELSDYTKEHIKSIEKNLKWETLWKYCHHPILIGGIISFWLLFTFIHVTTDIVIYCKRKVIDSFSRFLLHTLWFGHYPTKLGIAFIG